MNLLRRELRANRKSLIIWSLAMAAFMYASMLKFTALSTDAAAHPVYHHD